MNVYCKQVEEAVRAVEFVSTITYAWFGKQVGQLPPAVRQSLTPRTARSYLLFNLRSQLYADFYCQGLATPAKQESGGVPAMGMTPFVEALSAANSGSGYWEDGWEVDSTINGKLVVRKGDLELWTRGEDCLIPEGSALARGAQLSLRFPKEYLSISPGFYMVSGDVPLEQSASHTLVRMYWNLSAEVAVPFMRFATSLLNRAHVPFKLKIVNDPSRFTRCDAAVIYLTKPDYERASEVLEQIYPRVAVGLRQGVPAFTKQLAPGVGLAEDPGKGESFGIHRCQLLAEGMVHAHEQDKRFVDEQLQAVVDRFAESGISIEVPFLNPDNSDDYEFRPRIDQQVHFARNTIRAPNTAVLGEEVLRTTAHDIGQRLAKEAIWQGDRCNWLGAEPLEQSRLGSQSTQTYTALGPELYSGTSGLALFLAELFAATGDTALRRTALGAIRQALGRVDAVPPASRLGLYTGWIGIAFAAAHVGTILGEEEPLEHVAQILQRSAGERLDECEYDLMSGYAGAIVGILLLRNILEDASLVDFAQKLGNELLRTANEADVGYSWKSVAVPTQRNLTGFSHGTAGVGYALLELYHASGDSRYMRAAEQAFRYERSCFDTAAQNWPDFREGPGHGRTAKHTLSFATFWCHGAPGIALSRLRAYEVLRDQTCKDEATTAVQTTVETIEKAITYGVGNFSLCHGLAGNAEVLLYGCRILGKDQVRLSELAHDVAYDGIQRYAARGHSWPCGTGGGGETPSLMLGLAGIGHFYLHLHNARMPSPLILRREDFLSDRATTH